MRECGCAGRQCEKVQFTELTRRAFLGRVTSGAAAVALASQLPWLEQAAAAKVAPPVTWPDYPLTPPRVYRDAAPGGGRHAHRRHRHRQHLAGRPGPPGRLADLQQPERDADSRQLLRRLAPERATGRPSRGVLQTEAEGPLRAGRSRSSTRAAIRSPG